MSEMITWTLNIQVEGGPKLTESGALTVEAYDKIGVHVPVGGSADVQVQPGDNGQVQFLLLQSTSYGENLTYDVSNGGATGVKLDAPQFLLGMGAIGLLDHAPQLLTFTNGEAKDATIKILVGRNAIAP